MSDQTPQEPPVKKPGFFSRLFTAKDIEPPPDDVSGEEVPESVVAPPAEPEADVFAAGPAGFDSQPILEPEPAEGKKTGLWGRFFGKKDQKETEESEAETLVELPEPEPEPEPIEKKNWFQRLRERLRRGSGSFIQAIRSAVGLSGRLDDETVEKLEEILVASDVSMDTAIKIVDKMRKRAKAENIEGADGIMQLLRETLEEVFTGNAKVFEPKIAPGEPYVVMVVGVNGVGKTTTIGKIAKRLRDANLKVMLVAGDTFRAAAIEQLDIWAERTGCELMKTKMGADPSGLAFDALKAAKARGFDVVLIDTAGRLHTKTGLMDELGKVIRVCKKIVPDAPHETLLALDATTGQNAIQQVKIFGEAAPLTGLVMTKLDGTAKGGVLITLRDQFDVPVTLVGVGEGIDDLRDFDPAQYAKALFGEE